MWRRKHVHCVPKMSLLCLAKLWHRWTNFGNFWKYAFKRCFIFSPHLTSASVLPAKMQKHLHSLAVLLHCQISTSHWLNLFSLVTHKLVSWSLTSLFSTNMAISETKGQEWKVICTQWRKASDILTSTLAAFLFSSHPKKGKGSRGSFKLLR